MTNVTFSNLQNTRESSIYFVFLEFKMHYSIFSGELETVSAVLTRC
jgi:hypothetical protein